MKPFLTILLDSYRGLKSEMIFWITLGLSALVAVVFLSIGIHGDGISVLFGLFSWNPSEEIVGGFFGDLINRIVYLMIFSNFVAGVWLTFIATILALISCASIFPNSMNEGAAGMLMTKKPSRLLIFFAKLTGSLLFVLVQVGLFVIIVFFAFRWRLGVWNFSVFWYVPAVLLVFLNLYSVMVLIGVRTRSVLTSILITMLVWGISAGLNAGITGLQVQYRVEKMTIEEVQEKEAKVRAAEDEEVAPKNSEKGAIEESISEGLANKEERLQETREWLDILETVHLFLPKNGPIMAVAEEKLVIGGLEEFGGFDEIQRRMDEDGVRDKVGDSFEDPSDLPSKFDTIGTSCLFCGVMLTMAAWVFCRKEI